MKIHLKKYYVLYLFVSFLLCVYSLKLTIYSQELVESAFVFIMPLFLEVVDIFLQGMDDNGYYYKRTYEKRIDIFFTRANFFLVLVALFEIAFLYIFHEMNLNVGFFFEILVKILLWIYPLKYLIELILNLYILYRRNLLYVKRR